MNSKNKKIIIAEDEKAYNRALQLKLTNCGFEVLGVDDGEKAVENILKDSFDLLILDLIMPKMNGFEVLTKLKENNIDIPVIILSNLTQNEDKAKVAEYGVKEFIEKADTSIIDIVNKIKLMLN